MIRLEKKKGSKTNIWEGSINSAGIIIRYGSEGRPLRTITIPEKSCDKGVDARLNNLVAQQIRNGFIVVESSPESVQAVNSAHNEVATRSIKEALDNLEPHRYSTW